MLHSQLLPKLTHACHSGCEPAQFVAAFGDEDPGTLQIAEGAWLRVGAPAGRPC